jgi:AcrR family transcriptional regulator
MVGSVRKKGEGYHHGQLRRAVLDAALELIVERGVGSFSMREVARRAGVSHNAPYHHFADKGELVEELVVESFGALTDALHEARAEAVSGAVGRLQASGVAYVRFAFENPERFRLMFRPELKTGQRPGSERISGRAVREEDPGEASPSEQAGGTAYGVLVDGIVECQREGSVAPGDPASLALTAWSTVHGLAVLILDGPESEVAGSAEEAERAARVVTETLGRGLIAR